MYYHLVSCCWLLLFFFFCIYFYYRCLMCFYVFFLFFFKQKTAYELRISDWSSDVCSSDLAGEPRPGASLRRQLPDFLGLHPPLHPFAVLRLRLRLRRLPREFALRRLSARGVGVCREVSGHAEGGRHQAAPGAPGPVRARCYGSGLLAQGAGRDRRLHRRA